MKKIKDKVLNFLKENDVRLTLFGYTGCSLLYNIFGTSGVRWTDFYYSYTMGLCFGMACIAYSREKDVFNKLILNWGKTFFAGQWAWFIIASFIGNPAWKLNTEVFVSWIITVSVAQLFALYKLLIKLSNEEK